VADGPPATVHHHEAHEIVSWLQKAIRRGDTEAAVYCALELEHSGLGAWLWKRLRVICPEDVGPAWPEGPAVIEALHGTYLDLKKGKGGDHVLMATHAAILLADAPKSRVACWAAVAWPMQERREVDDAALDRHARRGRQMGRSWTHSGMRRRTSSTTYEHELEARYRDLAGEAVEDPQPPANPGPPSLFDE
jgi:replication-associated recombination protein RarA